jgi:hypothetical protein
MLEPTITLLYLIVDFEVQLSTPTTMNIDERFPYYSKMKQPVGKGRKRETGGKEWKLTLCFTIYISWSMGTTVARITPRVRGSHHSGEGHTTAARVTPRRRGSHHGDEGHTRAARVTPRRRGSHHGGDGHTRAARVTPRRRVSLNGARVTPQRRGSPHGGEGHTTGVRVTPSR